MTQKFFKGDLIQLSDMPKSMSHFPANCKAIVLYSYSEQYGGGARFDKEYGLYILPNKGETAWYHEDQLTLIEPDRFDLLPKGNTHRKVYEAKQQRDEQCANQK